MPKKRHFIAISFALLILLLLPHFKSRQLPLHQDPSTIIPANSTLGFGAIVAVSHPRSPRRANLLWAANLTDLDIVVPQQPEWTENDVEDFKSNESTTISRGSALAWMGHLHALKWSIPPPPSLQPAPSDTHYTRFLNTTHSTALLIEDDVDFSLAIRQTQIPLFAASIRHLFNTTTPSSEAYFGPQNAWDLLYPGHCDDLPSPLYTSHPTLLYLDPTSPPIPARHPATHHFAQYMHVPPTTRLVHRAFYPFCTFAYAVTRASAARIVARFSREEEGGASAFDVQFLKACRDGWRCWSVVPELFHHGVGGSEIARADGRRGGGDGGTGGWVLQDGGYVRATWNIECGARGGGLWVDEGDGVGRERVRGLVRGYVQRGECPVGRVGEEGWVGCEEGECGAQS
ncbi:hypothetical protein DE146DRAFT_761840 [Phaeosphaeria sp. MPI-PUGE-AT-0046c]|nr:hypothetical protein DE146DRAFT_761840 [Phaeosphaeria sp. MPI-PUGE-AT-0046c]